MDFSLSQLKGIGPKRLEAFEKAGIRSVRDLLNCLPRSYRDLSDVRPVAFLKDGEEAALRVRVIGGVKPFRTGKLTILRVRVEDATGSIAAVWYNQPWLKEALAPGRELLLYGKVEKKSSGRQLTSPSFEQGDGLRPVYKNIPGIPAKLFEQAVRCALTLMEGQWPDELPESLRRKYGLCERNYAMLNAHLPISWDALAAARRRLAFEELLTYQVAVWMMRGGRTNGIQIDCPDDLAQKFWKHMPFSPTNAQKRVLYEVLKDMRAPQAMARLVQGDVGCGKTAIAFGALYAAVKCGWQAALMAPTEVLASQHYAAACQLLEPLGITCGLLTGSMTAKQHRQAHQAIKEGSWQLVIGTHALITESVVYKNLGLVITDEQHRFGVRQRTRLSDKGESPNVLVMSATPIPRTLSLILYGDLDLSLVDELPPGRTPVKTSIVPEQKREAMYGFLRAEVERGHQIYVVCPLVEDSEVVEARSAEQVYEALKKGPLYALRLGLVHGKMKNADKDAVLDAFRAGNVDVLVSTTVIEVGVNVPNASVMVIENAERFGLAQLHQLRGRVGRGAAVSWCFLMAEPNERLRLLASTNDGFKIAEKDLEIRGPGEILGFRQSGSLIVGPQAMLSDTALLKETHDAARQLMKTPDTKEARSVIALAQELFARRLDEIAMN